MLNSILSICRANPQIILFLALGVGYACGKIKYRGFGLGTTTCVLLAALVFGQIGIDVPSLLKTISFALFTFIIGYKVGPQFFGALKKEGLNYVWISVVVAVTSLAGAIIFGKLLHFDQGTCAGFFAGSVTQSAALGTAEGAIKHLAIPEAQKTILDTNLAVAYAITYIFGTAGGILFFKFIPKLMGFNLKEEASKLEEKMSGASVGTDKPELFSWTKQLDLRAFCITNKDVIGKPVSQLESLFPGRVTIEKIKRQNEIITSKPDFIVQADDIVVITGRPKWIFEGSDIYGSEVDVTSIADVVGEILEVCILNSKFVGKTLGELSKSKEARGIFLNRITRQGHELPITNETVINKCDVIQLVGTKEDLEKIVNMLGYPERPTSVTDLVMVGIGCVLGTLIGLIAVPVAGIPLTLGVGGGVLVAGLFFGWLRSVHPTFGQIPSGGQWILQDLGLNLFIACVGISAGPKAIAALQSNGLTVFLAGIILCLLPFITGLIFGKYILKMNIVLLLGALAGSRVLTAALNTLQEDAESTTPVLGYAAPYAFGNVLLTIWGSIIINVM